MKNALAARIERLERASDPAPGIVIAWGHEGESEADAMARTLGEMGIAGRPPFPVAFISFRDREVL